MSRVIPSGKPEEVFAAYQPQNHFEWSQVPTTAESSVPLKPTQTKSDMDVFQEIEDILLDLFLEREEDECIGQPCHCGNGRKRDT